MARRALTDVCLALVRALETTVPPAMAATGVSRCRIGLSGGADSLALTAALAWARDHRRGPLASVAVTARVVDHQLQPGSHTVAATAAAQAEALGIAADIAAVRVDPARLGVEAAARDARYAALADGPDALILLAHTLDDQAETVLLGLARGSGPRSLAGMPDRHDRLVRPFLGVRRSQTEQACRDWGLTWWEDPANADPAYARSRLRTALGRLDDLVGPRLAESLSRTAALCREDADFLDQCVAATAIDTDRAAIPAAELASLAPAVRHRLLLVWLRRIGQGYVTRDHVLAVDALLTAWHGQAGVSVPGGQVRRVDGTLVQVQVSSGQD